MTGQDSVGLNLTRCRVIASAAVNMVGSFGDKPEEKVPNYLNLHDVSLPLHRGKYAQRSVVFWKHPGMEENVGAI